MFFMIKCFVFVLSYDLWFYVSHRLLHTSYGYAFIHKYHHAVNAKTIRYSDTYVAHFAEGPLQSLGVFFPLFFTEADLRLFLFLLLFLNLRGMLRHDARFAWLVGNHHILHHEFPNCNFGDLWMDALLGTRCPDWSRYKIGLIYN